MLFNFLIRLFPKLHSLLRLNAYHAAQKNTRTLTLDSLPDEIKLVIFEYLDGKSLRNLRLTCVAYLDFVNQNNSVLLRNSHLCNIELSTLLRFKKSQLRANSSYQQGKRLIAGGVIISGSIFFSAVFGYVIGICLTFRYSNLGSLPIFIASGMGIGVGFVIGGIIRELSLLGINFLEYSTAFIWDCVDDMLSKLYSIQKIMKAVDQFYDQKNVSSHHLNRDEAKISNLMIQSHPVFKRKKSNSKTTHNKSEEPIPTSKMSTSFLKHN